MGTLEVFKAIEAGLPDFHFTQAVGVCGQAAAPSVRVWFAGAPGGEDAVKAELATKISAEDLAQVELQQIAVPLHALASSLATEPGGPINLVAAGQGAALGGGTLGCFVRTSDTDGDAHFLTAAHVVSGGKAGDSILLDCGPAGTCPIGKLVDTGNLQFAPVTNAADCALGVLTMGQDLLQPAAGSGVVFSGKDADPATAVGKNVKKIGAATGVQTGMVCAYPASGWLTFNLLDATGQPLRSLFVNQALVEGPGFGALGDSGSLAVLADDLGKGDALGILIGGSSGTGAGLLDLFAVSPMDQVRKQLSLPQLAILT